MALGQRVRSLSMGLEGELIAIEGQEGVLSLGALKTRRPLADLAPAKAAARGKAPTDKPADKPGDKIARALTRATQPLSQELPQDLLDLRGLRAEEAVREAELFLDRAFGEGKAAVRLLHGQGSGALKASLREFLSGSRYVRGFRAAELNEGGEGTTVVELAL